MHTGIYPSSVEIIEVGPRDGLQHESTSVSTDDKVALINALVDCGLKRIQVTSFVHPRLVPQMADAEDVCQRITRHPDVVYSGLALNLKGVERAAKAELQSIDLSVSANDEHSRRNANRSTNEALDEFSKMYQRARELGVMVRGGIQCAFGYRQAGDVEIRTVVDIASKYRNLGVDELAVADSAGLATPSQIAALLSQIMPVARDIPVILHLHDTRGMGLANVYSALRMGVRHFDTAIGGMGGCPFIDGAKGNIATEDTAYMLDRMGIETGIDLHKLAHITRQLEDLVGKGSLPGKLYELLLEESDAVSESV